MPPKGPSRVPAARRPEGTASRVPRGWIVATAALAAVCLLAAIVVLLACAMIYRPRSQVRPETLAALLLMLEIWILETRRQGGPDRAWWLVPIGWLWIGAHVSFWVSWVVCACFVLEDWRAG